MSEWLPQVVKITSKEKLPNSDFLSITEVNGYPVIFKTNEFNVGDLVGYIPIDSIVPDTEQFYFLAPQEILKDGVVIPKPSVGQVPEKYRRIKAKKIRGIYSQGIFVKLPENCFLKEGDSIIDLFNLKKFETEEDFFNTRGQFESPPKGWTLPFYDLEGLRPNLYLLKEDEEVILTEKLNGSNASYVYDGNKLWVKSRRYFKKDLPEDPWWFAAKALDLENKLKEYPFLAFFGECYGNVKGFKYDVQAKVSVRFFDIYDIKKMRFLDFDEAYKIVKSLNLDWVPVLYCGPWKGKEMFHFAEGNSTIGKNVREGFVVAPIKERIDPISFKRIKFKLIGETYNLL